jgi:hypothetical protein
MAPAEAVAQAPVSPEALRGHEGEWVAIRGGEVVASAATLAELRADERVADGDAFYRVPLHPGFFY